MKSTIAAVVSVLAAVASAKKCTELKIPITATGRNGVFDQAIPHNEIEITNYVLNQLQQGVNYTQQILKGYATVSQHFSIAATYCEPDSGPSTALQILTHGIGFDRSYWDLPFHNYNYSYVNVAVDDYGFSTFAYDRPGIGESLPHADPLSVEQALLEVDALYQLTLLLQAGKVKGVPKFDIYTHGGHSFGAQHTYTLTAMYPTISDCITLQGFSQNGSFIPYFGFAANLIQANTISALKAYQDGWFADGDSQAVQYDFFAPNQFDPKILAYAVANGEPVSIGELLTIGGETASVNKFAGPAHIVTGERDIPYCGGNCYAAPTGFPTIPSTSALYLPRAAPFKVDISKSSRNKMAGTAFANRSIVANAGHGLNLEYSHPQTYNIMLDFLVQNGCGPAGGKYHN